MPGREAQLGHLAGRVLLDERARAPLGDDLGLVHDHEPVAQLLGLVHVVSGQHERDAALLEPVEPVPEQVPGLRVEPGRRLVEEQDRRLVDERSGDRQAPLHPARQRLDLVVGALGELGEFEQLVGTLARPPPATDRSSGRRSTGSRGRSARRRACPAAARRRGAPGSRGPCVAGSIPITLSVPSLIGETQPIIRIVDVLPAPFGPRKPNDSPRATSKSMASTATNSPNRLVSPRAWMSEVEGVSDMGAHGTAGRLEPGRPTSSKTRHAARWKRATMR